VRGVDPPRDADADEADQDGADAGDRFLRPGCGDQRLRDRLEPVGHGLPAAVELDPAADDGELGEDTDCQAHRPLPEAVAGVRRVLADVGRLLPAEDDEQHPERVEAGQERASDADREQHVAVPVLAGERRSQDRVLREEA
jgi:hypothetical protein